MHKILATLLFTLFAYSASADRVDYLATTFDGGMPDGTLSVDRDGQTLHFTMVQAGFDQGDAWKVFTIDGNSYAASPARHKVAKGETALPADDWMILPAVRILAADATIAWDAKTIAESIDEGCAYEVRISTRGGSPEDFTEPAICTISDETLSGWAHHSVSLDKYAGREVWIAFVHTSLNREILAVDNINVGGSSGRYQLTDRTARYQYGAERTTIKAQLQATSSETITGFTAYCDVDGETISQRFDAVNISAGSPALDIVFTTPRQLAPGDVAHYSLRVEVDGNTAVEQPAVSGDVLQMLFATHRRVVAEEGTGMWCGYCPRGIVAMRQMREKYPDDFIGIAVHYDDALYNAVKDYCNTLHFPSFPSAYVNRTTLCGDPMPQDSKGHFSCAEGLEKSSLGAIADAAPADVALTWAILPNGLLGLTADAHFAITAHNSDYRFTAVAVEDGVSAAGYYQTNYYSGSATPIGGFENEAKTIKPFAFDEVARAALLPFDGIEGEIPATVEADRHYAVTKELKAPTYSNLANMRVVLMLLDGRTGEVVNAIQTQAVSVDEYNAVLAGCNNSLKLQDPSLLYNIFNLDGRPATGSRRGVVIEDGRKSLR